MASYSVSSLQNRISTDHTPADDSELYQRSHLRHRLYDLCLWCLVSVFRCGDQYRLSSQLRRERLQLLSLSDEQLNDIGLTRDQALSEGRRSWGDVPSSRRR